MDGSAGDRRVSILPNLMAEVADQGAIRFPERLFALLARFKIVRLVATIYIEIFRGSSALVQIYFIFFVLPLFGVELPSWWRQVP